LRGTVNETGVIIEFESTQNLRRAAHHGALRRSHRQHRPEMDAETGREEQHGNGRQPRRARRSTEWHRDRIESPLG
jgi:hypothetical protein